VRTSVAELNQALAGFNEVVDLSLSLDNSVEAYGLFIILSDGKGSRIMLKCAKVSRFNLTNFGGGLTQFLKLRAEDVRAEQLDRVSIRFVELERRQVEFYCDFATVSAA